MTEKNHSPLKDATGSVKGEIPTAEGTHSQDASTRKDERRNNEKHPDIPEKAVKGLISSMEDVKKGDYITLEKGKPDTKEFNLSKPFENWINRQDLAVRRQLYEEEIKPFVREFIKRLKEIKVKGLDETCKRLMLREIDKLAGKNLSGDL